MRDDHVIQVQAVLRPDPRIGGGGGVGEPGEAVTSHSEFREKDGRKIEKGAVGLNSPLQTVTQQDTESVPTKRHFKHSPILFIILPVYPDREAVHHCEDARRCDEQRQTHP